MKLPPSIHPLLLLLDCEYGIRWKVPRPSPRRWFRGLTTKRTEVLLLKGVTGFCWLQSTRQDRKYGNSLPHPFPFYIFLSFLSLFTSVPVNAEPLYRSILPPYSQFWSIPLMTHNCLFYFQSRTLHFFLSRGVTSVTVEPTIGKVSRRLLVKL